MFTVELKVAPADLLATLRKLESVGIGSEQISVHSKPSGSRSGSQKLSRKTKASRGLTQRSRLVHILSRHGTGVFALTDLYPETDAMGISRSVLYNGIAWLVADGKLRKIAPGMYQRTGQSFIQDETFDQAVGQ